MQKYMVEIRWQHLFLSNHMFCSIFRHPRGQMGVKMVKNCPFHENRQLEAQIFSELADPWQKFDEIFSFCQTLYLDPFSGTLGSTTGVKMVKYCPFNENRQLEAQNFSEFVFPWQKFDEIINLCQTSYVDPFSGTPGVKKGG